MKKQLTTAVAVAALITIGGFGVYHNTQSSRVDTATHTTHTETTKRESIAYNGIEGQTALATLVELVPVETQSSEFGDFVTSIDGSVADSNSEYWAFYVNGELAPVGASSYITQDGDMIEWKLESF